MTGGETPLSLLRETLAFAIAQIPYYRERADSYGVSIEALEELERLPVVTPEAFVSDPRAFSSGSAWPDVTTFSSATMGDVGRTRWRSYDELEAMRSFAADAKLTGADDVTLWIHAFDQGQPALVPGTDNVICVPFGLPWHCEYIFRVLKEGYPGPSGYQRVERLVGYSPALRILTVWLNDRDARPETFGLKSLEGFGSVQPPVWRRRLERAWGAPYQDLYGLSEVVGSEGRSCPVCGAYHFSQPVVSEVVDPASCEPIREGIGELLLTELIPYARLQLLIRYRTGDLVEIGPSCMASPFGFRFRGRLQRSVTVEADDAPPLVVGALQVGEICSDLPDVVADTLSWADWAPDVGPPRFLLSGEGTTVRVAVELRYDPELHVERAASVRETLCRTMAREIKGLSSALKGGDVQLEVKTVRRGALESVTKV